MREFTAEFLEKALEPSGWRAVWRTSVLEVLVEVSWVPPFGRLSPAKSSVLKLLRPKCLFLIKVYEPVEDSMFPHGVAWVCGVFRTPKDPEEGPSGDGAASFLCLLTWGRG